MKRRIPKYFHARNDWMGAYCVMHGLLLWFGFGGLAWYLGHAAFMPTALQVLLIPVCIVIAGMGMFYVTTLSHEGFHGCLNRNRQVSMWMGMLVSSAIPGYVCVGYTLIHWPHHVYTNTERDPDFATYSQYRSFLARVGLGPMRSAKFFFKNTIRLIFRPESVCFAHYPLLPHVARRYAILNLALVAGFLVAHIQCAIWQPVAYLFVVALPMLGATCYLGMVPYIDHAGTNLTTGLNARDYTSRVFTFLLMGTNYHREHHLYPGVPSYKLPALHRFLLTADEAASHGAVEPGFLATLRIGAVGQLVPEAGVIHARVLEDGSV